MLLGLTSSACSRMMDFNRSSSTATDTLQYADFDADEVAGRQGKVHVLIPPAYELIQVAIALTETSQQQPYRYIHPGTAYYQEVQDSFQPQADHPLIQDLDEKLHSPTSYRALFGYQLTEEGLTLNAPYHLDHLSSSFRSLLDELGDFAQESNFQDFYQSHADFYQEQIDLYREFVPVHDIWKFMEANFPAEIDSYRIILSPLMVGTNNTIKFQTPAGDFTEILLFVPAYHVMDPHPSFAPAFAPLEMTRSVFTEIDHNYVNPVTDRYLESIDEAMPRLQDWHTGRGYPTAALKFNEYYTWAVFFSWAREFYPEEDFQHIARLTLERMDQRGFVRFEPFVEQLLALEREFPDKTLAELMPLMIEWMGEQ